MQRIEPGRQASAQLIVLPTNRADEQFGATILVEKDDPRRKLARLGEQEIEHHRLARTRGTDDREIAQIVLVEIEEVGAGRRRLEQGDGVAPVIALGLADGEIVQAGKPSIVARRDQRAPADIAEIAGELCPERGFERDILAHADHAKIAQHRKHFGHLLVERGQVFGVENNRRMMLAEGCPAGRDRILGYAQFFAQADRLILGRAHASQR